MFWRRRTAALALCVAAVVAAYGFLCSFVAGRSLQTRAACAPVTRPPAGIDADAVRFPSAADGILLAGWITRAPADRAVIVLHGIDAYAGVGADADIARAYAAAGFKVFLMDHRAHGSSEGTRIALGALERGDVRGAVDLLLDRGIEPGRIAVHGTSFGAAMALLAASIIPEIGVVVADSSYADMRDLIAAQLADRLQIPERLAGGLLGPGVQTAAWLFYGIDMAALAPERVVPAIAPRPILFIHGTRDPVIPVAHARRLVARAGPTARIWLLEGLAHTQGVSLSPCTQVNSPVRQEFLDRVVAFLESALESSPAGRRAR